MRETSGDACSGADLPVRVISVLDQVDEVEAIAPAWRALVEGDALPVTVFQSPGWLLPAIRRLGDGPNATSMRFVVVCDRVGLAMIAPFAVTVHGGVRVLEWLGAPVPEYGDVIVRKDCDAGRLLGDVVSHLNKRDRLDAVHLSKVREDAAAFGYLSENAINLPNRNSAPFVKLTAPAAAERHERSSRSAKGNRRKRRRLAELGTVSFAVHAAGERARGLARVALEHKQAWLDERGLVSRMLGNAACTGALLDAVGAEESGALVSGLSIDGRPIAIEIGFVKEHTYYSYLAAIDPQYARFSPGSIQLAELIEWCRAAGLRCFDLLGPEGDYKRSMSTGSVGLGDWAVPLSLKGRAYAWLVLGFAWPMMKAAFVRSPKPVRQLAKRIAFARELRQRILALMALGGIGAIAASFAD